MEIDEANYNAAILLIYVAVKILRQRRLGERLCGYPEEYGGDKFLLERMEEFLNKPNVKQRVIELQKKIN